jgi:hypothetical protein
VCRSECLAPGQRVSRLVCHWPVLTPPPPSWAVFELQKSPYYLKAHSAGQPGRAGKVKIPDVERYADLRDGTGASRGRGAE